MKTVYIFGNGNTSFEDFQKYYAVQITQLLEASTSVQFILCEFRGVDTLSLEYLKTQTKHVTVLHVGSRPRYMPDRYKTYVDAWTIQGGFASDEARDQAAIERCTHFLAIDFNSDEKRKSGTQKNIEKCLELGKNQIR